MITFNECQESCIYDIGKPIYFSKRHSENLIVVFDAQVGRLLLDKNGHAIIFNDVKMAKSWLKQKLLFVQISRFFKNLNKKLTFIR